MINLFARFRSFNCATSTPLASISVECDMFALMIESSQKQVLSSPCCLSDSLGISRNSDCDLSPSLDFYCRIRRAEISTSKTFLDSLYSQIRSSHYLLYGHNLLRVNTMSYIL